MASLYSLPVELLTQIALETSKVSERDLFMAKSADTLVNQNSTILSMALVCRPLYAALRHLRFRVMRVHLGRDCLSTSALEKESKRVEYFHSKVAAGSVKTLHLVGYAAGLPLSKSRTSLLKKLFTSPAFQNVTVLGLRDTQNYNSRLRWLPRESVKTVLLTTVRDFDHSDPPISPPILDYLGSLPSLRVTILNYNGRQSLRFSEAVKLTGLRFFGCAGLQSLDPLQSLTMLEIERTDIPALVHLLVHQERSLTGLQILSIFDYFEDCESDDSSSYDEHMEDLVSLCPNLAELHCSDLNGAYFYGLLMALPASLEVLSGDLYSIFNISYMLDAFNRLAASGRVFQYELRMSIYDDPLEDSISYCIDDDDNLHWLPSIHQLGNCDDPASERSAIELSLRQDEQTAVVQQAIGNVLRRTLGYHKIRYDTSEWPSRLLGKPEAGQRKITDFYKIKPSHYLPKSAFCSYDNLRQMKLEHYWVV